MIEFFVDVKNMLGDNDSLDIIYIDDQKTLDQISHHSLCRKLASHDIKGNVLSWIKEWLSDRKQRVAISGSEYD